MISDLQALEYSKIKSNGFFGILKEPYTPDHISYDQNSLYVSLINFSTGEEC